MSQLESPYNPIPQALSLLLWVDWWGGKTQHWSQCPREGGLPFPGVSTSFLVTASGVGSASLPSSHYWENLVLTGWGRSYLAQSCPDSHPHGPKGLSNIQLPSSTHKQVSAPIPGLHAGF